MSLTLDVRFVTTGSFRNLHVSDHESIDRWISLEGVQEVYSHSLICCCEEQCLFAL